MPRDRKGVKGFPDTTFGTIVGGYFPWMGKAMTKRVEMNGVLLEGLSVRFDYATVLVVVRGLRYEPLSNVVAFGSGLTLYLALRNVTIAMEKNQWKADKFNKVTQ